MLHALRARPGRLLLVCRDARASDPVAGRRVRSGCKLVRVFQSSFPRRQQSRRLRRAAASGAAAIVAGALAATAASVGATALAGLLALVMAGLVVDARRWRARPRAAASALSPRLRFDERSAGSRRRGGSCGTRSRVAGAGISTASRSPRPGSRCESKTCTFDTRHLARARQTAAGFTGIGGAGAVEERSRCCAWWAPAGSSTSRTRFSWCRWTAWRRRSEPAREPHPAPGSWPRKRLRR